MPTIGTTEMRILGLFLSYFLRTEPVFGKELIEDHLRVSARDAVLFTDLDKIRTQPALQELAKQHLDDPDKAVAANAAYIFKYGRNCRALRVRKSESQELVGMAARPSTVGIIGFHAGSDLGGLGAEILFVNHAILIDDEGFYA